MVFRGWQCVWAGGLLALAGCRAVDAEPAPAAPAAATRSAEFPGAPGLLLGFDRVHEDPEWREGDAVLFGLELQRGAERRRWLLHVRLLEPLALGDGDTGARGALLPPITWHLRVDDAPRAFHSRCARVAVTVATADGEVLGRSSPLLPRDLLARGFGGACALVAPAGGARPDPTAAAAAIADAAVAAVALLQVVQQDAVLAPLLWQVVDPPSLWSLARHLGAHLELQPRFAAARAVVSPVPALPVRTFQVPMTLASNGTPVLEFELAVTPVGSPLGLSAGVLAATARHPQRRDVAFSLRLLAARAGRPVHWSLASGRDIALDRR